MTEDLQAAIERAFIDLHYAAAELKLGDADGASAAIEHVKLALRALHAGLRTCRSDKSPPPREKISG